jgi:hypothetical protein
MLQGVTIKQDADRSVDLICLIFWFHPSDIKLGNVLRCENQ